MGEVVEIVAFLQFSIETLGMKKHGELEQGVFLEQTHRRKTESQLGNCCGEDLNLHALTGH